MRVELMLVVVCGQAVDIRAVEKYQGKNWPTIQNPSSPTFVIGDPGCRFLLLPNGSHPYKNPEPGFPLTTGGNDAGGIDVGHGVRTGRRHSNG